MKSRLFTIIIIIIFAVISNAAAQPTQKDLQDIVAKQQDMLDEMQTEIDDLNSYLEEDEDEDDLFGNINIHGFISQGYIRSKESAWFMEDSRREGSFQFNEIGLNFTSKLGDKLRFGMQILSRDFGVVDNNKVNIDWAYMDYRHDNLLGLRVGKIKMPLGLKSKTRDIDMLRTNVFLPLNLIYGESTRETFNALQGIGLYGRLDLDAAGSLNYETQFGYSSNDPDDGGIAKLLEGSGIDIEDIHNEKTILARAEWETPVDGLILGGTYFKSVTDMDFVDMIVAADAFSTTYLTENRFPSYETWVASMQYTTGDLVLSGEYIIASWDQVSVTNTAITGGGNIKTESEDHEETHAWYVMADYRLNSFLSIAGGYSEVFDDQDRDGKKAEAAGGNDYSTWQKDWFVGTKVDITDNWIFKAELHFLDGTNINFPDLVSADGESGDDIMLALKTTVSF